MNVKEQNIEEGGQRPQREKFRICQIEHIGI